MSDIEFFAKFDPKPFKSLAAIEKERIAELRLEKDGLRRTGKLPDKGCVVAVKSLPLNFQCLQSI